MSKPFVPRKHIAESLSSYRSIASHGAADLKQWGKRRLRRDERRALKMELRQELPLFMSASTEARQLSSKILRQLRATREAFARFALDQCFPLDRFNGAEGDGRTSVFKETPTGKMRMASCAP